MSGTVLAVSDLDRTLIYSPSALALPMDDHGTPVLVCVETLDGRPHSFMTLYAARALRRIAEVAMLAPVTTRTVSQYRRIRFADIAPHYAITSNGGNIIVDGQVDIDWNRSVHRRIADDSADLGEVIAKLKARTDPSWALKRRTGDDLFCYLVVDPDLMPADFLAQWRQWCAGRNWVVSMQGRKIYAIPSSLSKEHAMFEVADRVSAGQTLAAGDGALDAGLLMAADRAIRPPHGELAVNGWHHPGVEVAARPGVLAADDITDWFLAAIAR